MASENLMADNNSALTHAKVLDGVASYTTPNITASGGVQYVTVEVFSDAGVNLSISGKINVACVLGVRHNEELQFGFALLTDGTVSSVVSGAQVGTSPTPATSGIEIGLPEALPTPDAMKFRIPITNNTANNTKAKINLVLGVQDGFLVGIE